MCAVWRTYRENAAVLLVHFESPSTQHDAGDLRPSYASNRLLAATIWFHDTRTVQTANANTGVGSGLRPLYGSDSGHFMVQVTSFDSMMMPQEPYIERIPTGPQCLQQKHKTFQSPTVSLQVIRDIHGFAWGLPPIGSSVLRSPRAGNDTGNFGAGLSSRDDSGRLGLWASFPQQPPINAPRGGSRY